MVHHVLVKLRMLLPNRGMNVAFSRELECDREYVRNNIPTEGNVRYVNEGN